MQSLFVFGMCALCMCIGGATTNENTYRAAIIRGVDPSADTKRTLSLILEAKQSSVDILVLPPSSAEMKNHERYEDRQYEELVQSLSDASKRAHLYLVSHLIVKTKCQDKMELIRTNLVFDRKGDIISEYRKSVSPTNCTTNAGVESFSTDFGVTFAVLEEEELLLQELEQLKGLKNFVVTERLASDLAYLNENFISSWAFVNKANIISNDGIFAGQSSDVLSEAHLVIADMEKDGKGDSLVPPEFPTTLLEEDLSPYEVRAVSSASSEGGRHETVCHGHFCCEFYVKTKNGAAKDDSRIILTVFNGIQNFNDNTMIGTETCAVLTCAAIDKRACIFGSNNNSTDIAFEKISVTGNFSNGHGQYPTMATTSKITPDQFNFKSEVITNKNKVTLEIRNIENIHRFGIFGRDKSQDSVRYTLSVTEESDVNGYIFNSEFDELFDYFWIRLRIMIFVVSVYLLEMM